MLFAQIVLPLLILGGGPKVKMKDVKVGTGEAVVAGDYVTVEYTGKLKKGGKQFDSSRGRAPFSFLVGAGQVIKGWDIGLVGMKIGGQRALDIPSDLGYGARGAGEDIPANADLLFDVELLKVERAKTTTLTKGEGPEVAFGDSVKIHYLGTLKDSGKKFDSSYDRGEPFDVSLAPGRLQVIPGFVQGILGMKKGEKRKVEIPAGLAYGKRGAGGVIPPDADIVFELELVELKKSKG